MTQSWQHHARRIIFPSLVQFVGCTVLVLIMLSIAFWRVPVSIVAEVSGVNSKDLTELYGEKVGQFLHHPVVHVVGTILIIGVALLLLYGAFLVLRALYMDAKNDYQVTHELFNAGNPMTYHRRLAIKTTLLVAWMLLVLVAAFAVVPWALSAIGVGVATTASGTEFRLAIAAIAALIATVYVLLIWLELTLAV
jgi:hypothetical protein